MKKWLKIIAIMGFVLSPAFSYAFIQGYTGSDFVNWSGSDVNVQFCDSGSQNGSGHEYYWNTTHDYFIERNGTPTWVVTSSIGGGADYYETGSNATPDLVTVWNRTDNFTPTTGSFASTDCDTGGGGGATTTATTTAYTGPNKDEWLLAYCIILFFISLIGWHTIFSPINRV